MTKTYSRLEAKQWDHEYMVALGKDQGVRAFRKWLRENMEGPFKASVTFTSEHDLMHCFIRDVDDAILFKIKWAGMLK